MLFMVSEATVRRMFAVTGLELSCRSLPTGRCGGSRPDAKQQEAEDGSILPPSPAHRGCIVQAFHDLQGTSIVQAGIDRPAVSRKEMSDEDEHRPGRAWSRCGPPDGGPVVAGLVYVAAWVADLVIGPASLDVTAPGTAVVSAYAGQQGAAIAQALLTEGVAAVALAVVVLTLGQAARGRRSPRIARRTEVAGLAAVVLSLVRCVQGVRLAGWVAPGGDSSRAGSLFQLISRIDGVKMLLLSIIAVSGMTLARRARALPPRPAFPGVVLTAALAGGGFGYLALSPALAWLACVSLPLMLIWVAGMGLWLSRGPGVSQANRGQRPANREPGDRCLPQLPPAKCGHSPYPGAFRTPKADWSRADGLSHRQRQVNATDAKSPVAGHQPEPVRPGGRAARDLTTVRHSRPEANPGAVADWNIRPGYRTHDQAGDGDVHPVSIAAAR